MFEILEDYDWANAFEYAGDTGSYGGANLRGARPGQLYDTTPFKREDVAVILWSDEGENDGDEWIMAGLTKDERGFVLKAGCDYTGWDCQASGETVICNSLEEMVLFGLDRGDRQRLGIHIKEDN